MKGDVLDIMDAAIEQRCACLCGAPITDRSPSASFASEACSLRWHTKENLNHLLDPQRIAQALAQMGAMLMDWLHELAQALQPLAESLRAAVCHTTSALPEPPPPPKHGPTSVRRAPKVIGPTGGWYDHARGGFRYRPRC